MTVIKPGNDPGVVTFEILDEESDTLKPLHINVFEVAMYLDSLSSKETADVVTAVRKCAKPKAVSEGLEDHELLAKFMTAAIEVQRLGKEQGFSLTLPESMDLPSSQRESRTGNMQPA